MTRDLSVGRVPFECAEEVSSAKALVGALPVGTPSHFAGLVMTSADLPPELQVDTTPSPLTARWPVGAIGASRPRTSSDLTTSTFRKWSSERR